VSSIVTIDTDWPAFELRVAPTSSVIMHCTITGDITHRPGPGMRKGPAVVRVPAFDIPAQVLSEIAYGPNEISLTLRLPRPVVMCMPKVISLDWPDR